MSKPAERLTHLYTLVSAVALATLPFVFDVVHAVGLPVFFAFH